MKTFRLLLLDANVIIYAFEQGVWDKLIDCCDICISREVEDEAQYYDNSGGRHRIDLSPYKSTDQVHIFDVASSATTNLKAQFTAICLDRLDPGEAESLAFLLSSSDSYIICSSDAIVFRVLGALARSDNGISLEEILTKVGLGRKLPDQYTKSFREKWSRKGFEEGLQGLTLQK